MTLKWHKAFWLLFLILLIGVTSTAQRNLSSNAKISLLTCDPGDEVFTVFGHSAIWVFDQDNNINVVYNYGTFDFDQPNFYPKFLRGKLLYSLEPQEGNRFFATYDYYKRSVKENLINLDSIETNRLYNALLINAQPKNKNYLYDFFFDNCSTRIGDILESKVAKINLPDVAQKTYRELLHEYLMGLDWTRFGIDLIIGSLADKNANAKQQMFLPDYLQSNLESATFEDGSKVLDEEVVIVDHPKRSPKPFFITPMLFFSFLLLLEVIVLGLGTNKKWIRIYDTLWITIIAVASVVLAFMWFGTDHQACGDNYNLIAFSPLVIFWIIAYLKFPEKGYLRLICLLIVIPMMVLPFIKMTAQNIPSEVMLISLITAIKLLKNSNLSTLRKWV